MTTRTMPTKDDTGRRPPKQPKMPTLRPARPKVRRLNVNARDRYKGRGR